MSAPACYEQIIGEPEEGYRPPLTLLSCRLELYTKRDLVTLVVSEIHRRQVVLAHQNLHGMALLQKSDALKAFYRDANYCYIDGMPLIWLAKLCGFPARRVHRNTQLDWLPDLLTELGRQGRSLFFLGGPPQSTGKILRHLNEEYPGITVNAHHGYFPLDSSAEIVSLINAADPDLLILGMGMPRQERWLLENIPSLSFGVAIPSGAILEYFVGFQKTPSRLSGRLGLEWLVRLKNEPRRLGRRYLLTPWKLVVPAARDIWHYRIGKGRQKRRQFSVKVHSQRAGA
jgi:N-acetylglucosaminyldiphosphoundecaprenol N-acetyl-beta-D-mannosaminyltransferase